MPDLSSDDVHATSKRLLLQAVAARARPLGEQIARRYLKASAELEVVAGLVALREREERPHTEPAAPEAGRAAAAGFSTSIEEPEQAGLPAEPKTREPAQVEGPAATPPARDPQEAAALAGLKALSAPGRPWGLSDILDAARRRGFEGGRGPLGDVLEHLVERGVAGTSGPGFYHLRKDSDRG